MSMETIIIGKVNAINNSSCKMGDRGCVTGWLQNLKTNRKTSETYTNQPLGVKQQLDKSTWTHFSWNTSWQTWQMSLAWFFLTTLRPGQDSISLHISKRTWRIFFQVGLIVPERWKNVSFQFITTQQWADFKHTSRGSKLTNVRFNTAKLLKHISPTIRVNCMSAIVQWDPQPDSTWLHTRQPSILTCFHR